MTAPLALPPGPPTVLIVMGVSGAGKTTIGKALAGRLGWVFQDGDAFHPPANIAKMRAGQPLDDADRAPWLVRVETWISHQLAADRSGVVACSALKKAYRRALIGGRDDVILVYLHGGPDLIAERLKARRSHFMPPALLASQIATLEAPGPRERPIEVDIAQSVAAQVDAVIAALVGRRRAHAPGSPPQPPRANSG